MLRTALATIVGLTGLYMLGAYKEKHDLDYCLPARRLRWLVFKEELKKKWKKNRGN